ncbi:unnamed protein product [Hapterophycus canaliculatus]
MSDILVGVKATFSVRGETVHKFESSGQKDSSTSTAAGVGQQGVVEGTDKYDYRYTGAHDHGSLPALKTGGPHGDLASALLGAKEDSDAFLTGLINQELAQKSENADTKRNQSAREVPATRGGGGQQGETATGQPEAMELEVCGLGGGDGIRHRRRPKSALSSTSPTPPAPPTAQPAKRPRP